MEKIPSHVSEHQFPPKIWPQNIGWLQERKFQAKSSKVTQVEKHEIKEQLEHEFEQITFY